ncbi:hypothetical protein [Streptomyces luteireticuli]|uniref:hypothetical protein n=1 Tax=Streptomyces luteireticuli TaxID=173858 RepID=UPI0031DB39F4
MLIEHLPPESATVTALRNAADDADLDAEADRSDPSQGCWSQTELLLAQLTDAVSHLAHLYTLVNTNGGTRPEPPQPVPRPGIRRTPARSRMTPDTAETLFQIINGTAPTPP